MNLGWLESLLYGFISGLADILPVSSRAHQILLLKCFGANRTSGLQDLMIHLAIIGGLYFVCQKHILRMTRARRLSRVPKRRRRRPLDTRSLMDLSLLKTMLVPVILGLLVYQYAMTLQGSLVWVVVFLFVNGIILYAPQFLPSGNRDSRTMSRVEGLLMGLGGAFSVLPGISAMGAATSIGSVCGVDRHYALNMALMMNMGISVGLAVHDIIGISGNGIGELSFLILLRYILSAGAAFGGTVLGAKIMRHLAGNSGYSILGVYCWGLALFTFILNILA